MAFHSFPDHFAYPPAAVNTLSRLYQTSQAEAMVTTEKDVWKLITTPELRQIPLYYLKIDLAIEEEFDLELERLLKKAGTP